MKVNQQVIDSLGEKLNEVDLTNEERGALELAFALAGQSVEAASDDDVSGFKFRKGGGIAFKPASFPVRTGLINADVDYDSDKGLDYTVDLDFLDWA